jgi:hypothetical protein
LRLGACVLASPLAGACSEPPACTRSIIPALFVEVLDGDTEANVSGITRGVVRDGTYEDSLDAGALSLDDPPVALNRLAADERAGNYSVHLEADGYQPWDTAGIRVTRDACHVRGVSLTARLDAAPPASSGGEPRIWLLRDHW